MARVGTGRDPRAADLLGAHPRNAYFSTRDVVTFYDPKFRAWYRVRIDRRGASGRAEDGRRRAFHAPRLLVSPARHLGAVAITLRLTLDHLEEARGVLERRQAAARLAATAGGARRAVAIVPAAPIEAAEREGAQPRATTLLVHGSDRTVRVTTLGDLLLDVIVRPRRAARARTTTAPADNSRGAGGQAANVAAWVAELRRLGAICGKRGDDETGELVGRELGSRNVEVCGPVEGRTGRRRLDRGRRGADDGVRPRRRRRT